MSHFFKCNVFSVLAVGSCLGSAALLAGCGGGGGGGSSIPGASTTFDGTYRAVATPSDALPSDGTAPSGTVTITNGRANTQFIYRLQPSVVSQVQAAIDQALTSAGYASAIANNQVPALIEFMGTGDVDASGKLVLTTRKDVSICGRAVLTLDTTLSGASGAATGTGTYNVTFPNNLIVRVSGTNVDYNDGTCNNLPLRTGTVALNR